VLTDSQADAKSDIEKTVKRRRLNPASSQMQEQMRDCVIPQKELSSDELTHVFQLLVGHVGDRYAGIQECGLGGYIAGKSMSRFVAIGEGGDLYKFYT